MVYSFESQSEKNLADRKLAGARAFKESLGKPITPASHNWSTTNVVAATGAAAGAVALTGAAIGTLMPGVLRPLNSENVRKEGEERKSVLPDQNLLYIEFQTQRKELEAKEAELRGKIAKDGDLRYREEIKDFNIDAAAFNTKLFSFPGFLEGLVNGKEVAPIKTMPPIIHSDLLD